MIEDLKTIDLSSGHAQQKKEDIKQYFLKTWELDEKLYTQLASDEVFYMRGDSLRHIILFYLGHTAVFYINKLYLAKLIDQRIEPYFESIFAIGVDEMSWDDLDNNHYHWPEVHEVRKYREKTRQIILELIDDLPLNIPINWNDPFWIILMGIEHERIHLETSSVLIRQLPLDKVVAGKFGKICSVSGEAPQNYYIKIDKSEVVLGKPEEHKYYGWDNEYGVSKEKVDEFEISGMLISNGEFLEFIQDSGYEHPKYWTEEGWNWRTFRKAQMPLFWIKADENYRLRLVAEEIPMPWNWPVEVNYLEAKAFANWKSMKTGETFRLPTEAEWYRMHELSGLKDVDSWAEIPANMHLGHYTSPCPVDMFRHGDFHDVTGNVWQWTETPITGFQGFKVHPMYDDFSTPTFDGKHNLIKGGSWISTGNEATYHSRYAFRRHFYQHAGFRLVKSDKALKIEVDSYETDPEVAASCEAMWGDYRYGNYSLDLLREIQNALPVLEGMKVLDMDCDTGRLSMEMAVMGAQVTGLDLSARFIRVPLQFLDRGFMRYTLKDDNDLLIYKDVLLHDKFKHLKGEVLFMQDNPNNLKEMYTDYDLMVLPGVLEQLNEPKAFLRTIHQRLNPGGWLVISTDYNWSRNVTDKSKWPGGFKKDGEPLTSLEGIMEILLEHFELKSVTNELPQYIRRSSRNMELKINEITVWKLKNLKNN